MTVTSVHTTTPTAAPQVEVRETPLPLQRTQLSLNDRVHLQGREQDHPTQDVFKPCWEKKEKGAKRSEWTATEKEKQLKTEQLEVRPTAPPSAIPPCQTQKLMRYH